MYYIQRHRSSIYYMFCAIKVYNKHIICPVSAFSSAVPAALGILFSGFLINRLNLNLRGNAKMQLFCKCITLAALAILITFGCPPEDMVGDIDPSTGMWVQTTCSVSIWSCHQQSLTLGQYVVFNLRASLNLSTQILVIPIQQTFETIETYSLFS